MKQISFKRMTTAMLMAALVCATAAPLKAEEKTLSLREMIAVAKENNKELRALYAEKGIGEAGRIRAGLYPNPVLELEGATGAMTGSSGENRIGIGLFQEFLTGGKREKRLALSEAELVRFERQVKNAERQLVTDLKVGFYDLILAEERREVASRSMELNNQLLQIARERFAAGEIAELDVNLAKVEAARSAGKTIEVEREIFPLRQRLFSMMGIAPSEDLKLVASPEPVSVPSDLTALKTLALQVRPDLQAVSAEQHKSEAELTLAEAERLPNVTAGIGLSREGTVTSLGGIEERDTDYLIGVKLSVPIPLFDKNQAGIREAQAKRSSAEIRQQYLRQNIEREVGTAYARLTASEAALKIYRQEIMPQLAENLKLIQEAYRLGEVGILAVIEEQKKFVEVNEGNLSALQERNRALAQLEAAVGTELNNLHGGTK